MAEFTPQDPNYQTRVKASFQRQRFMETLGATLERLEPGVCEIHLAYRPELSQQHGYFHGGLVGTLADNASGYASYTLMGANDSVLTVEYKISLVAPGEGERLVAVGTVVRPGRTLTTARADVFAENRGVRTLCATALATLFTLAGQPDGPRQS
ncbi:MAG: PaaI family thioesterase [Deltaproteobacteria bacterium]|nr:PaaI family thioesterase [Deltaproteobacteria bacterium]